MIRITRGANEVLLGYDAVGRRQTLTLPNGIVATHSYDDASQLVGIQYSRGGSTLGDLTYAYDAAGQRIEMGGSFARMTLPQPLNNAAYNAANRLTNWEGVVQTYDLNGNLTNDGSRTYTWDTRNRLSGITGGATAAFKYDGTNRRYEKTVAGVATGFLYDGLNPAHELTGTTTAVKASLMTGSGLDQFFARIDTAGTSSMITDGLGSTIALAGANGAVATQYTYEPYGKTTQIGAASENAFQYTGRENDVTGLYYYRARYYDPDKSRFLSEDPIGLAGGANVYAYVGGNPISYVDPLGLDLTVSFNGSAAAGAGHVGFSVNSPNTVGQRPQPGQNPLAIAAGRNMPGEISPDPAPDARVVIPTTSQQDRQAQQCIDQRTREQQDYNLYRNNCAQFVGQCLRAAGVPVPETRYPRTLFNDLERRFGGRQ